MVLKAVLFYHMIVFSFSACNNNCSTCLDQNSLIGICTSCYNNYFLYGSHCFDCNACDSYGTCNLCQQKQTFIRDQSQSLIIFISILSIIFLCIMSLIIYCKYCSNAVSNQSLDPNASQVTILELVLPNNLEWKKGEKNINNNQSCAICLQNNVYVETKCHHLYHPNCIWQWSIKRQQICPLCKSKQISPIKFYCSKCSIHFLEINVSLTSKIISNDKWDICSNCKILGNDFYQ